MQAGTRSLWTNASPATLFVYAHLPTCHHYRADCAADGGGFLLGSPCTWSYEASRCLEGEQQLAADAEREVLVCPMCIDLHGNDLVEVGVLAGVPIDLAAQLIGASAVHASRFAALARLDLAQAFKKQDAARIASADLGNLTGDLVGGIFVETVNMPPEVTVTVFALDWPARLPLLFGDLFQMAVAWGGQPVIGL